MRIFPFALSTTHTDISGSYEKRKMSGQENKWSYHFIGFTSLYQFLYFPDKTRLRLSQFVILPPYQGQGHGGHLYSMVYLWCLTREDVAELCSQSPPSSTGLRCLC